MYVGGNDWAFQEGAIMWNDKIAKRARVAELECLLLTASGGFRFVDWLKSQAEDDTVELYQPWKAYTPEAQELVQLYNEGL
jgi:hypothetical protein